jgi:2-polyprenyl-3-methyl-5-hydroxy-6-metoxy-1,4-benzoquinol methylase
MVFLAMKFFLIFQRIKTIKILDIGCGNGSLLAAAKEKGYTNVTGIDISPEQVEIANKLGVAEVRQGNLNDLINAGTETFDLGKRDGYY